MRILLDTHTILWMYFDSKIEFERYVNYIYKYALHNDTYYLLVIDSGGSARFADIFIYRETGGELEYIGGFMTLDQSAKVISFNGQLYLIERSYNYYTKFTDTITIYKLTSDGLENYVCIYLSPEKYQWKNIDSNGQPYEEAVTDYVNSIKEDLMIKSQINDDLEIYTGDETTKFDRDKLLRLNSVAGEAHFLNDRFYEIDYNNDGVAEYIDKRFWFPSNYTRLDLITDTYIFTDKQIVSTNSGFSEDNVTLVQLWFKEIEGKTFTFRLFLTYGYNYLLNVALIENTYVTQVQNYLIAPESVFVVRSGKIQNNAAK